MAEYVKVMQSRLSALEIIIGQMERGEIPEDHKVIRERDLIQLFIHDFNLLQNGAFENPISEAGLMIGRQLAEGFKEGLETIKPKTINLGVRTGRLTCQSPNISNVPKSLSEEEVRNYRAYMEQSFQDNTISVEEAMNMMNKALIVDEEPTVEIYKATGQPDTTTGRDGDW